MKLAAEDEALDSDSGVAGASTVARDKRLGRGCRPVLVSRLPHSWVSVAVHFLKRGERQAARRLDSAPDTVLDIPKNAFEGAENQHSNTAEAAVAVHAPEKVDDLQTTTLRVC